MRIFAINRKQDTNRREHMRQLAEKMNFKIEFFQAVDGARELNILDSSVNNVKFLQYKHHLFLHDPNTCNTNHNHRPSYGIFGAAISHQLLYYKLLNDPDHDMCLHGVFTLG